MKTFKKYLTEAPSSIPQLKPSFFLGEIEKFDSLNIFKSAMIRGIAGVRHTAITDVHKQIFTNLINDPDANCLKNTGLNKITELGSNFVSRLNADFGECVGPVKILKDLNYMPWINPIDAKIYIPKRANEPFLDFAIIDKDGIQHKISSKTARGVGNTVKTQDIKQTIEDSLKDSTSDNIINKLFFGQGKYKQEYDVLQEIFVILETSGKSGKAILKMASLLDNKYGNRDFAVVVDQLTDDNFYNDMSSSKKGHEEYKIPEDIVSEFKTSRDLLRKADVLIKLYTKAPSELNKALKLLINIAFQDKIYYAKFAVNTIGTPIWEVRGRKTDYSDLYFGNKYGTTRFTKLYFDSKGARGNEYPGLRIESYTLTEGPKWIKAYRAEGAGRGVKTDALKDGIYFFPKKPQAELWAGRNGKVIERNIRIDTASIQEVGEGEAVNRNHDVIVRKDPRGSGKILEIIVFDREFIK